MLFIPLFLLLGLPSSWMPFVQTVLCTATAVKPGVDSRKSRRFAVAAFTQSWALQHGRNARLGPVLTPTD